MTHIDDLHRIEINHLREMLRSVKEENENFKTYESNTRGKESIIPATIRIRI